MAVGAEPAVPARVGATAIAVCAPLALLAVWLVAIPADHAWRASTIELLQSYAALLVAACAGARFGMTATDAGHRMRRTLLIGALPVLAGWIALRLDLPWSFAVLGLAASAQGAWDSFAVHRGELPLWFGRCRAWIAFAAVAAMVAGFAVTAS